MESQQVKQIIIRELPLILQHDREMQDFILQLSRRHFADKGETTSRFDRVLDELRRDREENTRKWENALQHLSRILAIVETVLYRRYKPDDTDYMQQQMLFEQLFYNAAKLVLEKTFRAQLVALAEYDDAGEVFGRPDQVELDVIIQDGILIVCEIKSAMSKSDMYIFERKVRFYEKRHGRTAARKMVISPMVDDRARAVAAKLGIEVYSYAEDIDPALFA